MERAINMLLEKSEVIKAGYITKKDKVMTLTGPSLSNKKTAAIFSTAVIPHIKGKGIYDLDKEAIESRRFNDGVIYVYNDIKIRDKAFDSFLKDLKGTKIEKYHGQKFKVTSEEKGKNRYNLYLQWI